MIISATNGETFRINIYQLQFSFTVPPLVHLCPLNYELTKNWRNQQWTFLLRASSRLQCVENPKYSSLPPDGRIQYYWQVWQRHNDLMVSQAYMCIYTGSYAEGQEGIPPKP
jgi:hypothetical protein